MNNKDDSTTGSSAEGEPTEVPGAHSAPKFAGKCIAGMLPLLLAITPLAQTGADLMNHEAPAPQVNVYIYNGGMQQC